MADTQPTFDDFAEILRTGLGDRLAPDTTDFLDMFAQECVFEFPYAPPGFVRRIDGREALGRYLAVLPGLLKIDRFFDLRVHEAADGTTVILEFRGRGEGRTGAPYDQQWISVIETSQGRIARYVDYWDPRIVLAAAGDTRPEPEGEGFTYA